MYTWYPEPKTVRSNRDVTTSYDSPWPVGKLLFPVYTAKSTEYPFDESARTKLEAPPGWLGFHVLSHSCVCFACHHSFIHCQIFFGMINDNNNTSYCFALFIPLHILLLFLFFTIYMLLCCYFYIIIIFYYFALSTERT